MKSRIRYILTVCLSLLLVATMLCSSAAEPVAVDPLNYGFAGAADNKTVSAAELFAMLAGEAPTQAERDYLNTLSGQSLVYNDAIPDSLIDTDYLRESRQMKLAMSAPYRYTASNGLVVEWIPKTAVYDGREIAFASDGAGGYIAVFDEIDGSDGNTADYDFEVDILFSWTVEISKEQANLLLGAPYAAAAEALGLFSDYEQAYRQWETAEARYQAYTSYMNEVAAFEEYERQKIEFEGLSEQYRDYQAQMDQQKLYDDWQKFHAYQTFKETQLEDYNRYLAYKAQVGKVEAKLGVLENLFVRDSNGWQLYASLMGNTVTEVVNRKDELMVAGVPHDVINQAGDATEKLRVLMSGYAALRDAEYASEHDKLTALYAYYTVNYPALRDQFFRLYGALHDLYNNDLVTSKLSTEGKLAHYQQFVGVLYITRSLLDDGYSIQASWRIGKKTLAEVVEPCNLLTDTVRADPQDASMPESEVPEIVAVPEVDEPTRPQPQTRPNPPYMEEPKAPIPVTKPDESTAPPYAEDPGDAPLAPVFSAEIRALYDALKAGQLSDRRVSSPRTLTFETTVKRRVSNDITVTFYRDDGTVFERRVIQYTPGGVKIEFKEQPAKASDAQYHYAFRCWVTRPDNQEYGDRGVFTITDKDLSLYPDYEKVLRKYTVTWVLNGESRSQEVKYGTTPTSLFGKDELEGREDEWVQYQYKFSGWNQPVTPVTGNVTYTGTVEKILKKYNITWVLGNGTVTEAIEFGRLPNPTVIDYALDGYRYRFTGWNKPLRSVSGDETYTATYEKIPLVSVSEGSLPVVEMTDKALILKGGAENMDIRESILYAKDFGLALAFDRGEFVLTVEHDSLVGLTDRGCRRIAIRRTENAGEISYTVAYYNNLNREIKPTSPAVLRPAVGISGVANSIYVTQDGNTQAVDANGSPVTGGFSMTLRRAWSVTLAPVKNCNISQIPTSADVGQTVNLKIGCTFGWRVASARVLQADGTEVPVNDLCFVMPNAAVTVELEVVQTVYHVTFVVDGVVISEADYFLGEDVQVPANPVKPSDERYDYMFAGWSREPMLVAMGDDLSPIYEATFIVNEIPEKDPSLSGKNTNRFLTIYLPIIGGAVVIGAVATILILRWRKKPRGGEKKPRGGEKKPRVGIKLRIGKKK